MSRRADRLLQIVQILRRRNKPTTAMVLAEELEVVPRTIYRDIAALQASRVPIDGVAGVGYVLRAGYDLPPLMFTTSEVEALVLGLNMVAERGDADLSRSSIDALAKIRAVLPRDAADHLWKSMLLVPHALEQAVDFGEYLAAIREAVRESRKLRIGYADADKNFTERTIWPLGLYLYSHVTLVCAWCETRSGFRTFRSDRLVSCVPLKDRFDGKNGSMLKSFLADFAQAQQVKSNRVHDKSGKWQPFVNVD